MLVKTIPDVSTAMILIFVTDALQVALRVFGASMTDTAEGTSADLRHEVAGLQIPQSCVVVVNLGTHAPTRVSDHHICAIPEFFWSRRLIAQACRHVMPTENAIPRLDIGRQGIKHRVLIVVEPLL